MLIPVNFFPGSFQHLSASHVIRLTQVLRFCAVFSSARYILQLKEQILKISLKKNQFSMRRPPCHFNTAAAVAKSYLASLPKERCRKPNLFSASRSPFITSSSVFRAEVLFPRLQDWWTSYERRNARRSAVQAAGFNLRGRRKIPRRRPGG